MKARSLNAISSNQSYMKLAGYTGAVLVQPANYKVYYLSLASLIWVLPEQY